MNDYQLDYFHIMLMLLLMIIGAVSLARNPQKQNKSKNAKTLIIGGALLLVFNIVLNSSMEHRWDVDYVLAFICLKKVSTNHFGNYLRFVVSLGFVFIFLGGLQLLLGGQRKEKP